ncbi:MAG TPA: hypothetical protein VMH81_34045 [Bryobacteraceae bacterium]|nr:hypothetical protein [Bryobacteraceae bacterium]
MPKPGAAIAILASAFSLWGQPAHDPDDVLEQVRARLRGMTARLPHYTCVQTVERHYFKPAGDHKAPPSCDQVSADRKTGRTKLQLYATDRLRLDVAVADGREIVSWVGAGKFDTRRVDEVVGEGPTGTGAFGGHLVDIFNNPGVHFAYLGEKAISGRQVLEYRFTVPVQASNYRIRGAEDQWHFTAYDGSFQVDRQTLELAWLDLRTDELTPDTGMCEAGTKLEFQRLRIGESDFLLPRESELQIVQTDAKETTNLTTFSSCREYHAESTIRFEEETPDEGAAGAQAAASFKPLPEGLSLTLALTARIDTGTAAAGDVVAARVTHAVHDPKSKATTLIPANAIARGRIARMRHRVGGPDDFVVLLSFDALEVNGKAIPLFIKLDSVDQFEKAQLMMINRPRAARAAHVQGPETWGALIFPVNGNHFVVPAGYESLWHTVSPPTSQKPM